MSNIDKFVQAARNKNMSDHEIKERLLDVGWDPVKVYEALENDQDLVPPRPDTSRTGSTMSSSDSKSPISVMTTGFSGKGFEYFIYYISLGIVALSFGALLHNTVNLIIDSQKFSFYSDTIPMATAALIVALPIFVLLMRRLNKAEKLKPEIKDDPSRRRAVQLLMLGTFVVGVVKLIAYVYNIISGDSGYYGDEASVLAETLHAMVTIGIAGGIFVYHWLEQSKHE